MNCGGKECRTEVSGLLMCDRGFAWGPSLLGYRRRACEEAQLGAWLYLLPRPIPACRVDVVVCCVVCSDEFWMGIRREDSREKRDEERSSVPARSECVVSPWCLECIRTGTTGSGWDLVARDEARRRAAPDFCERTKLGRGCRGQHAGSLAPLSSERPGIPASLGIGIGQPPPAVFSANVVTASLAIPRIISAAAPINFTSQFFHDHGSNSACAERGSNDVISVWIANSPSWLTQFTFARVAYTALEYK
ncbi:hypothetical protein ANO11243_054240 [Dothideomycetidae sp. 11243]|nr:hypothetical protein ANO11243_054240 [fungal sp. No.11243]